MITTILLTTDGSPFAERAYPYAIAIARAAGARLTVLRAVDGQPGQTANVTPDVAAERRDAQQYIDRAAAQLRSAGIDAHGSLYYGEPTAAIVETARVDSVDLIVMASHGRGGLARTIYGSVAADVIRSIDVPVFLVPVHYAPPAWPTDRAFKIVVALDGSDEGAAALDPAVKLARTMGGALELVTAVTPVRLNTLAFAEYPYGGLPSYELLETEYKAQVAAAQDYLTEVANRLSPTGLTITTTVIANTPALGITDVATQDQAAAIAMATHGRTGLARLIMGSVATAVFQRSSVPVLLVRVRPAEGAHQAGGRSMGVSNDPI